ncbi:MAG: hypothetical protein UY23_C0001G0213 [Candidatus Jorgensenbacteria bacterium GW2011_GWA1_48_11]|uniref:Uncharacterized protein n=1 Tax=Candidatus Jorgensenbacteria bacterium GW2011_GWA1_48_11 TaxID=1618660 RepID=A0A0G1UBW2_9BACT|nr:MAG: hypothetical protein UY23_C0001G0213 [Candidatus Jorgensenbacteria bacterium GW2011_GWA1_48_11]KKW12099.1 MAG: hypothetical protein UY51_C0005G0341 [Candidatus Jorgensenbacteria bacterium GW2011_GWB1_49_9]
MNIEQGPTSETGPIQNQFAEKLAARRKEEERVKKMMAAGFRRGDAVQIDGEEWQLWDTYTDEGGEGVKAYKIDPTTKKMSGEKKISFEELRGLKEIKEAA